MTDRFAVPIIPLRRLASAAALCLALCGGTAAARDPVGAGGGIVDGGAVFDPNAWGGAGDPFWPEFGATGGVVYYDTSGGYSSEVAREHGFEVQEFDGGLCIADPVDAFALCDGFILSEILNGSDPYAGAELDYFVRAPEGSQLNGVVLGSTYGRQSFLRQSALTAIRSKASHRTATGDGVVVAVLDTGLDRMHEMFDVPGRVRPGWDFVDEDTIPDEGVRNRIDEDGDGIPDDGFGHGTTVAGLVLAAAPGATILPVRVLDAEGLGTAGRVAAGIHYAVAEGADVVNLSLGGTGASSAMQAEILAAVGRGVSVVAAAGNLTLSAQSDFPASIDAVISATGRFGLYGDVWAPANRVDGPYPGGRWFRGTGTSFAAALVSGGVALARERHPGVQKAQILAALPAGPYGTARLDLVRIAR